MGKENKQKYTITSKSNEYLLANIYSSNDRYMIAPVFITSEEFVRLIRLSEVEKMYHRINTTDMRITIPIKVCELLFNNITIDLNDNEIEDVIRIEVEFIDGDNSPGITIL